MCLLCKQLSHILVLLHKEVVKIVCLCDEHKGVRGTGPNFDGGVPLVNAKTHPCLKETKGPDKPHV